MKPLILVGFMGCGKSTVAPLLSEALKAPFEDLDELIVTRIQMPIARYFDKKGEQAFRQIETEILKNQSKELFAVIASGGGIVEKELNRKILKDDYQVIYLKADFDVLWKRIHQDTVNIRPLTKKPKDQVQHLFEKRQKLYDEVSDLTIDVSNHPPKEIIREIINRMESPYGTD